MQITSTMFTNTFLEQSNALQQAEANVEDEISTGLKVINPGDDPTVFGQVGDLREDSSQNAEYTSVTSSLTATAQSSYNGISQLQTLVSQASSLITEASTGQSASNYQDYGEELQSIASQIADIVNTKVDGVYVYGSTGNVAPLVPLSNPTSNGPQYQLNTTTAGYISAVTTATINTNLTASIGLTAGSYTSGANDFSGFVTDGSTTDIYTMIASAASDLLNATGSGDPFAGDANVGGSYAGATAAVDAASTYVSQYVGRASAQLSLLETNSTDLETAANTQSQTISGLTAADTATAATQLTQIQTAYEAALESGAKILDLNMLDYLSS